MSYIVTEILKNKVLLMDGAMGTEIQKHNPTSEDYGGKEGCNEFLVLNRPKIIESIHADYLKAGADIIETNTFGGTHFKLAEYDIADQTFEVNFQAAQIARKIADEFSTNDKPRFVFGSMGPTGFLPSSDDPELSKISFDELAKAFQFQARALVEGGVDAVLIETSQDILEVKAAIYGIHLLGKELNKKIPLVAQVTLDTSGRMLLGTDIGSALTTIESLGVDVIGMNCSTGPEHMRQPARYLCEHSNLKVSCVPNAGLPINQDGHAVYPLQAVEMAKEMEEFIKNIGVNIIGGCCGTTPEHIHQMSEMLEQFTPKNRKIEQKAHYVSSAMKSVSLIQEPRPMIIGERLNSQGSRRVKRLLLEEDYDTLIQIARGQIENGAHILDVCVALTERDDELETMELMVKKLGMTIDAPLVIDSTDTQVIEAALKQYPGTCVINSINLENGRDKVDSILPLAKDYGASVIALTIDEDGMAKVKDKKLEIAKRIYDIYVNEYNLEPGSLLFDVLTFTLATGEDEWKNSAIETLDAIKAVKEQLPDVLTTLGLSNCSFGLKPNARKVINSVFLYHAVQNGLDSAIVNPADIIPYASLPKEEIELAENLIFNKQDDALLKLSTYFEEKASSGTEEQDNSKQETQLSVEEAIHNKILHRKADGIEQLIDEALEKYAPVDILNNILLGAMKEVGDKFGTGELILPFVLQSAEVMKRAVNYLENFLEKKEGSSKGKVLLATVYGDVHDIGKNLVKTILSNNGYLVYDIGKQVPVSTIIEKADELQVDAIGLSALLVSTSKQMGLCIKELAKQNRDYPVLIGGAAINRNYGRKISVIDDENLYQGGVFYCKDAFEGLDVMDQISDEIKKKDLIKKNQEDALQFAQDGDKQASKIDQEETANRSSIIPMSNPPKAPFLGTKVLAENDIDLNEVFNHLAISELYRLSWGGRGKKKEEYNELVKTEFEPKLQELKEEVLKNKLFEPRIVYGYYSCFAEGNELIILSSEDQSEIGRFKFPRQNKEPYLCLADYFSDKSKGIQDIIPMQVVTIGKKAGEVCEELNNQGDYSKSYYLHGLSVQTAEALADWSHQNILKELGLAKDQGKRFSFGYPACPELEDQSLQCKILDSEKAIGVGITSEFQLVPEQSTSALIILHPSTQYFRI